MNSPQAAPTVENAPTGDTSTSPNTKALMMRRDGYLPADEAAEDLGVGKRWLRDGLNQHGFPHTRMGQAKWLSREDREYIRKLCHVPAEPNKIARFRKARKPAKSAA